MKNKLRWIRFFLWRFNFHDTSVSFTNDRSSCPEVLCKKGVVRNFAKLTGKHLRQSLFLNKVAVLRPATLLKKRLWHSVFLFFSDCFCNERQYTTKKVRRSSFLLDSEILSHDQTKVIWQVINYAGNLHLTSTCLHVVIIFMNHNVY